MNAVEIKNLSKNFGPKQAVCGLNMTVPMGAIYGFIGENGSGKSTTEKMICGLIPTSGGSIKLYGKDYTDETVRAKMGDLFRIQRALLHVSGRDDNFAAGDQYGMFGYHDRHSQQYDISRLSAAAARRQTRTGGRLQRRGECGGGGFPGKPDSGRGPW